MGAPLTSWVAEVTARRNQPERELQKACAEYMRHLPPPPAGPWWTAVSPNAGKRTIGAAKLAKAMGLQPGTPDILVLWNGAFTGIELKAAKGSLSDAQDAAGAAISQAGGNVLLARTVDEFQACLAVARARSGGPAGESNKRNENVKFILFQEHGGRGEGLGTAKIGAFDGSTTLDQVRAWTGRPRPTESTNLRIVEDEADVPAVLAGAGR